jgi:hypothetical protein
MDMPPQTRRKVNWSALREEYLSTQIDLRTLAQKHAASFWTIAWRCRKEKWVEGRSMYVAAEVRGHPSPVQTTAATLANQSSKLREGIAAELERDLDVVAKTVPARLSDSAKRQAVLKTITDSASTIHRWNETKTEPAIRIHLMSQNTVVAVPQPSTQPPALPTGGD